MDAKLICTEGAVKFSINGEIIEPLGFMTYNIDSGQFQRMNEIGNRIVFYTICASDRGFNSLAGIPPLALRMEKDLISFRAFILPHLSGGRSFTLRNARKIISETLRARASALRDGERICGELCARL